MIFSSIDYIKGKNRMGVVVVVRDMTLEAGSPEF